MHANGRSAKPTGRPVGLRTLVVVSPLVAMRPVPVVRADVAMVLPHVAALLAVVMPADYGAVAQTTMAIVAALLVPIACSLHKTSA
jgi:hypothetical protein